MPTRFIGDISSMRAQYVGIEKNGAVISEGNQPGHNALTRWCEDELLCAGLAFPPPRERARRLKEAVTVIRQLLQGGCTFKGDYYDVDLPAAGPKAWSCYRPGRSLQQSSPSAATASSCLQSPTIQRAR